MGGMGTEAATGWGGAGGSVLWGIFSHQTYDSVQYTVTRALLAANSFVHSCVLLNCACTQCTQYK